ncbi:MAG TPA: BamA/TamA family outer membrane protein [Kofleriaceae bacterium]|nr:BamA/TamA family outer membrane protein [Kofleriaceae bacterium]
MRGRLLFPLVALSAIRSVYAAPQEPQPQVPAPAQPAPAPPPADIPVPAMGPDDGPAIGEPEPAPADDLDAALHEDNEFGPVILIEHIDITGNTATQTEIIRRALPIAAGDVLHASDKRLRDARFKVLALGFFRDVALSVHKGSLRGQVIIEVHVIERGTLVLNRLWFGTTSLSPWWLGTDLGERNLFGLGIALGGGFIFAKQAEIAGARSQYAGEVRLAVASVHGTPWGISAATTVVHGSEPYRVAGSPDDTSAALFRAFHYARAAVRLGATYDITALTRLSMGLRIEEIQATLPVAPAATLPGGTATALDLHLDPGDSRVISASFGFDRDTRPDPILPHAGDRLLLSAELSGTLLGASYDFATLFGRYERYWPMFGEHHAIAVKLSGGVIVGDAPRFDRIHVADVDRMLAPRALGLVLSTAAPLSILGTRRDKPIYGDVGGSATIEYAFQLFRGSGKQRVYGGDVFLGAGLWGLAERTDLRARDTGLYASLPIDIYADAGLRIDTDIGTFELTIANALGRLR